MPRSHPEPKIPVSTISGKECTRLDVRVEGDPVHTALRDIASNGWASFEINVDAKPAEVAREIRDWVQLVQKAFPPQQRGRPLSIPRGQHNVARQMVDSARRRVRTIWTDLKTRKRNVDREKTLIRVLGPTRVYARVLQIPDRLERSVKSVAPNVPGMRKADVCADDIIRACLDISERTFRKNFPAAKS